MTEFIQNQNILYRPSNLVAIIKQLILLNVKPSDAAVETLLVIHFLRQASTYRKFLGHFNAS